MANNEPVVKIDRLTGLRNVARPERLPQGSLVRADNVDIDDTLTVERRAGFAKALDLANVQAAYAVDNQLALYVIDDGALLQIHEDLTQTTLYTGLPGGVYGWTEAGNWVVFSGPFQGLIKDGACYPLSIPTPGPPAVRVAAGSLCPGRYQVTQTRLRADGAEGGAPQPAEIELTAEGGLLITPDGPGPVYVSSVNGDVLYYAFTASGAGAVLYDGPAVQLTEPIEAAQLQRYPMPAGCLPIEYHEGRLFAAQGPRIWRSEEYWLHLFSDDYLEVEGDVRVLQSTPQGLFIGTDTALYSYSADEALVLLADYGVPRGAAADRDLDTGEVWVMTERGVCKYPPFANLTESKASLDPGVAAFTKIIDQRGFKRFLALIQGSQAPQNSIYS